MKGTVTTYRLVNPDGSPVTIADMGLAETERRVRLISVELTGWKVQECILTYELLKEETPSAGTGS